MILALVLALSSAAPIVWVAPPSTSAGMVDLQAASVAAFTEVLPGSSVVKGVVDV